MTGIYQCFCEKYVGDKNVNTDICFDYKYKLLYGGKYTILVVSEILGFLNTIGVVLVNILVSLIGFH
jgi:hypothetical protein